MADLLANRVASANSFNDLHRVLEGDRRLAEPLAAFIPRLQLSARISEAIAAAVPTILLGGFMHRADLHRSLASLISYADLLRAFKRALLENHVEAIEASLEQAVTFSELVRFVEGTPLARRRVRDVVAALPISGELRYLLLSLGGADSLPDFFRKADQYSWSERQFHAALDAFADWLLIELRQPATESNVIALPVAEVSTASLTELIAATGVPDLANWYLGMIDPGGSGYVFGTVGEVAVRGDRRQLKQKLQRFSEHLARLRAQPAPAFQPTAEPSLAAMQAAAHAERARLERAYPYRVINAESRLLFVETELRVEVRPEGTSLSATVTAANFSNWARDPKLHCTCKAPICVHRAVVLEGLAGDWVQAPKSCEFLRTAIRPAWERVLDAIAPAKAPPRPKRGVLSFNVYPGGFDLRFHEVGKRGPSSKGKRMDPAKAHPLVEGLDQRIAERLALADATRGVERNEPRGDALLMLEGHPRVSWDNEQEYRPVVRSEGTVKVAETDAGYRLELRVGDVLFEDRTRLFSCSGGGAVALLLAPDQRIVIARLGEAFLRLLDVTRQVGSELPREAAPRLVEVLPSLEEDSLVDLPDELRGHELEPTVHPLVRVDSATSGLRLSIRVEPLAKGPVFVPGQGIAVSASFDGRRRSFTRRQLEREVTEANALAGALSLDPALAAEPYSWLLDGSSKHVETLRRLSTAGAPVEWQAPKVKFTSEATLNKLRLDITRKKDWFGLDGEVTVDDRRVSLAALLEAARERRRFVKLGEGDFAQLSEAMIEALAPIAHLSVGDALPQLTPGTAPLLEALAPQLEALDAAKEWSALMERLAKSRSARFPVPRALKATLRDYQVEGFEWLSRLAQWGVGACLADDMGLGKTLQALALLLSRGKEGPALVVAPSSVLHTWLAEAARFSPSLRFSLFHEGDRALGDLGAMEVVVVSWSLLAREADAFSKVRFTTVVLDEAHAIKNAGTLRAKAAHRLQADFLVALSGTPIENHVGELWSLFKAVMPALLGSEESFKRRFSSGQKEALAALSTLIRPFVLRRTKGAVAKELPARTDLEVVVPLSAEERALYDDVRLSAMANLGDVTGESKRFDVLAALTRLRLTACHPKLVDAGWVGPTSKLNRLLELVESLSASGHRVLVFSQFTQHLALVVEALKTQGIAYSYLDGQVPLAERQRRVETFQAGAGGDVFLVSLKAGGTGLTLTAADYVIHLDPWWNPAVEDQASDRAHRIGQTRPVTVYRLIAEGTIEQQILSLHRDKRELVDALLSGADTVAKLSTTQLAELIRTT